MNKNIDIDLLRSFLTIYETKNFSYAADRLGRTQSTISQQIKKLEDLLGHAVLDRSNRKVKLTAEGEILLSYAKKIIDLNNEAFARISKPYISGTVKIGAPESFSANHLTEILAQFSKTHPSVGIEMTCGLSNNLLSDFDKGQFDIVLFKRDTHSKKLGEKVWEEGLTWVCNERKNFKGETIPLILPPIPCVYRSKILTTLEKTKVSWKSVFTSSSMTGRIAATKAGLGVTAIPRELLSSSRNLFSLNEEDGFPPLKTLEIALSLREQDLSDAAKILSEHIIFSLSTNPNISMQT